MKLFSRRKTLTVAAAAPIVAGMSAANYGVEGAPIVPPTLPGDWMKKEAASTLNRIVTPPKWRDFCNARDAFHQSQAQQQAVHNTHVFDLNIQALRSVSVQHKSRMQIESHRRATREAQSFLESLARNLGVWDFWKGGDGDSRDHQNTAQISRY